MCCFSCNCFYFVEFFLHGMNGLFPLGIEAQMPWNQCPDDWNFVDLWGNSPKQPTEREEHTSMRKRHHKEMGGGQIVTTQKLMILDGRLYSCTLVHQRYNYTYKATAQPTSVLSDAAECCRLVQLHFVMAYSIILEFLTTAMRWPHCWIKRQLLSSRVILLTEGWPEVGIVGSTVSHVKALVLVTSNTENKTYVLEIEVSF